MGISLGCVLKWRSEAERPHGLTSTDVAMALQVFPNMEGIDDEDGHAGAYPFGKFGLRCKSWAPSGGRAELFPGPFYIFSRFLLLNF